MTVSVHRGWMKLLKLYICLYIELFSAIDIRQINENNDRTKHVKMVRVIKNVNLHQKGIHSAASVGKFFLTVLNHTSNWMGYIKWTITYSVSVGL